MTNRPNRLSHSGNTHAGSSGLRHRQIVSGRVQSTRDLDERQAGTLHAETDAETSTELNRYRN